MFKLWQSFTVLLIVGVIVSAESGEGEYGTGEQFDGDLEAFRYYVQQSDSDQDSSSVEIYVPKRKRDVANTVPSEKTTSTDATEPPKVLLTDLIGKVEGSIVQSAVNIAQLLKGSKNNSEVSTTPAVKQEAETEAPRVKRTVESTSEAVPANKDMIVKYVTTKKVATEANEVPHVAIDHIAVSDAKGGLAPLFSSLDFIVKEAPRLVANTVAGKSTVSELSVVTPKSTTLPKDTSAKATEAPDSKTSIASSSPTTTKSGAPSDIPSSSTLSSTTALPALTSSSTTPEASSTSEQSSTTTSSSATSPTPTTTKNAIEQLKEVEDDVKEKVAEIEAEPIILSARV